MNSQAIDTKKKNIRSELNAPDLGERRSLALYKNGQILTLNIDQVSGYDKNPRNEKNAEYESIYESIKVNGLEDSLSVSQRPGDDPLSFFLIRGGNTRLKILKKLYKETSDKKYYEFSARFKSWSSESDAVIGHLRENDARGDYIFIDRALGVRQAKLELQAETGEELSDRAFIKALSQEGYKVSRTDLRRMNFAVDHLYPTCPKLLSSNIGPKNIDEIRKLSTKAGELFKEIFTESNSGEWETIFPQVLSDLEQNFIKKEEPFSYQVLYDKTLEALSKDNHLTANRLAYLLDERVNGSKTPQPFTPELLKDETLDSNNETQNQSQQVVTGEPRTSTDNKNQTPSPNESKTSQVENKLEQGIDKQTSNEISVETTPPPNIPEHVDSTDTDKEPQYIYENSSKHLEHKQWMYPESANPDFSIFQGMPLTCDDRIEAAPLPDDASALREILFYKAFFLKHYMQVPSKVERISSGAGFALTKIPHEQGMKLIFENPKDTETRIGKTTKHYIGWWILLGFSDLLHQSLIGRFDLIEKYQPEGNLKDYLLIPRESRLDTIDLIFTQQISFGFISEMAPLFSSYATPKELQLFIEMLLIHNRLMQVTQHDLWRAEDE